MSRQEYQRALGDLLRSPQATCALILGPLHAQREYELTPRELARLQLLAQHRGLVLQCMLYRASRMVGIVRRLPRTVALLGGRLRPLFDRYILERVDAPAEFDEEAKGFSAFLAAHLGETEGPRSEVDTLRATLSEERASLV